MQQMVKDYKNARERDRDIKKWGKKGWTVQNVTNAAVSPSLGKKLAMGFLAGTKEHWTVIYAKA